MAQAQRDIIEKPGDYADAQDPFAPLAPRLKTKAKTKAKMKAASHTVPGPVAQSLRGGRASFLVKIWRAGEVGATDADKVGFPEGKSWYGVVEHIQSGSKFSFEDEESLFRFMTEQAHRQQNRPAESEPAAFYLVQPDD